MADRALLVADILLEVFLYLPQRDLLMTQRVCRTWHSIIASSTSLQVALFFHPGIEGSQGTTISSPVLQGPSHIYELNPLLLEHFPAFFDSGAQRKDIRHKRHNLGPWNSTDWFRGKSREEFPKPNSEDKRRMAAYARAEASWRRMIPFRPGPDELQVCFGLLLRPHITGTLKCLKFSNKVDRRSDSQHLWLTFGLLYDIVEETWFRGSPILPTYVQLDFPYLDQESKDNPSLLFKDLRMLRSLFPQRRIGGAGCFLVHLNCVAAACKTGRFNRGRWLHAGEPEPEEYVYKDEFKSEGSVMANIRWDEEIPILRPVIT
jgi:F-box-like